MSRPRVFLAGVLAAVTVAFATHGLTLLAHTGTGR